MAQVVLECLACGTQVGLQFSDEEAPEYGCANAPSARHDWQEV